MDSYKLIVFDIDGTLTRSKLPLDKEMAELLSRLMEKYNLAIISGAGFEQFRWQILNPLSRGSKLENLYLLPTDGTVFCRFNKDWHCQADPPMSLADKSLIKKSFENIFEKSGLAEPEKIYGKLIEDRGSQLNFSALGQKAPIELKEKWDPDNKNRELIIKTLKHSLSGFSMRIGGTTSIEITRSGIDKGYGLKKLMKSTGLSKGDILYVGDKFSEGGNDAPVSLLGINCEEVESPDKTKILMRKFLE